MSGAWVELFGSWMAEAYLWSTIVLAVAIGIIWLTRQPARRLVVARSALVELAIIVPMTVGAGLVRDRRIDNRSFHVAGSCTYCPSIRSSDSPIGNRSVSMVAAFAAGSFVMVAWLGLGAIASARLIGQTNAAPERIRVILRQICGEESRLPALLISERVSQPLAIGLFRPSIVLPARFAESEPEGRIAAALAHEWAHIRNGDLWLLALGRMLLPILFVHPLFGLLRRWIRADQEALADAEAAVRGGRVAYAEALIRWTRAGRTTDPVGFIPSLGLWGRRSSLSGRIALILDSDFRVEGQSPRNWRVAVRGVFGALIIVLATVSMSAEVSTGPDRFPAAASLPQPRLPETREAALSSSILCCPP